MKDNSYEIEIGVRLAQLRGTTPLREEAKKMSLHSWETLRQWENAERQIKAKDLAMLARHYGVSVDYILGLQSVRSIDPTAVAATSYTGLSEETVSMLHSWTENADALLPIIDDMMTSKSFPFLLADIDYAKSYIKEVIEADPEYIPLPKIITYNRVAASHAEEYDALCSDHAADVFARFLVNDMIDHFKGTLLELINYSDFTRFHHLDFSEYKNKKD